MHHSAVSPAWMKDLSSATLIFYFLSFSLKVSTPNAAFPSIHPQALGLNQGKNQSQLIIY